MNNRDLMQYLPKGLKVTERLRDDILRGNFGKTGDAFLSVRELSKTMNVSVVTAHRIMNNLKQEDLISLVGNRFKISSCKGIKKRSVAGSKRQNNNLIGLVVTNLENPFFANLAKKVEQAAAKVGLEVIIASSNYDFKKESDILRMFQQAGVASILSCPGVHPETHKIYSSLPIPFVFISRRPDNIEADAVLVNDFMAGQAVAKHFIDSGFSEFAYIGIKEIKNDPRFQGFKTGLSEAGHDLPDNHSITTTNKDFNKLQSEVCRFVKKLPTPIAIFCFHDLLGVEVIKTCAGAGISISEKIGVAGFDNLPISAQISPSLTTIGYPVQEMAEVAIQRLIKKIDTSVPSKKINLYLEHELIIRESTSPSHIKPIIKIALTDMAYKVS